MNSSDLTPLGLGLDGHADVFRRDDKILRAILPGHEAFYGALVAHPVVGELVAEGLLVPVAKSTTQLDGYNLVLEHPALPFVTFPHEWTPSMFKAAAKCILALNLRLIPHGYCTQDGHLWNILFSGATPLFIDFTSIVKLPENGKWSGADNFVDACMSALKLMEKGFPTTARSLLRDVKSYPDHTLANAVFINTNRFGGKPKLIADACKIGELFSHFASKVVNRFCNRGQARIKGTIEHIRSLFTTIERMNVYPPKEMWSHYYATSSDYPAYNGKLDELKKTSLSTPKHIVFEQLLTRLQPVSVLDIGCNRGVYSQLAALKGARVVGIDSDELALDEMYRDSAALCSKVIPLFVNVTSPAEPITFKSRPFPTVEERLRSDLVLCFALIHHIALKPPYLKFPQIASILASFTGKYLIVEYVPFEDKYVQEAIRKRPAGFGDQFPWYTPENFLAALAPYFDSIETFDSHPAPRKLLLCRKR
jgi:SAM-dependent methyltransferase